MDTSRIINDWHPKSTTPKTNGDELSEQDVGRILTFYMGLERPCDPEDVGRRARQTGGWLQLEDATQRDVRKNLLPPNTILTGVYCSGCAAKGDDPHCECGGRGWVTLDGGFGPYHTGTVNEITHVAKTDWVHGI